MYILSKKEENISEVERNETHQHEMKLEGRRFVDLNQFIKSLQELDNHSKIGCCFKDMHVIKETRYGLSSSLAFKCKMCRTVCNVWTCSSPEIEKYEEKQAHEKVNTDNVDNSEKKQSYQKINTDAVNAIVNIGCGYTNLNTFLTILDVPQMSQSVYDKGHRVISEIWEKLAFTQMEEAAEIEKELAVQCGDVDKEGIPLVTVIVDGSWAKRSYRTNYSSLSGAVSEVYLLIYLFIINCTFTMWLMKMIRLWRFLSPIGANLWFILRGQDSFVLAGFRQDGWEGDFHIF